MSGTSSFSAASRPRARATSGESPGPPLLPPTFWYMGAKARLLPILGPLFEDEVPAGGTIADIMSGTGIVAAYCARRFRVFANDAGDAAAVAARSFIEHVPSRKAGFARSLDPSRDIIPSYRRNLAALEEAYEAPLKREQSLLDRFAAGEDGAGWCREYRAFLEEPGALHGDARRRRLYAGAANLLSEKAILARRKGSSRSPACLVSAYWANVYFGLRQAIEIDSIRAAMAELPGVAREEARRVHYLSALLHAASITTSGTSHFAQPRHLRKPSELRRMATRRRKPVLETFQDLSSRILDAVMSTPHLEGNRAFAGDYRSFIEEAERTRSRPRFRFPAPVDLIYFDPPYTADNYSRFYHVLDVIARYDYPQLERDASGSPLRGRYPEIRARFQSGFASPSRVEGEFRKVIAAASGAGSKLVISYASPTGLLLKRYARAGAADPVKRLERLCLEEYRDVTVGRHPLMHSGQGDSNIAVEELVIVCRGPR